MRLFLLILLLSTAIFAVKSQEQQNLQPPVKPRLFLVGGSLKTCSSMAIKNCNPERQAAIKLQQPDHIKTTTKYLLNKQVITKVVAQWPSALSNNARQKLLRLLNLLSSKLGNKTLSKQQLRQAFKNYDKQNLIKQLDDRHYYFLLDMLETPLQHQGQRVTEQVYLNDSINPFAIELYRQFVTLAASANGQSKNKPYILVATASARDPFEAVDFYTQVFTQAGATVDWLPLDGALQASQKPPLNAKNTSNHPCQNLADHRLAIQGSTNRDIIYPDLSKIQQQACKNPKILTQMIAKADGIFINGGDQSLTVQAFKDQHGNDYPVLKQIRHKINQGKLILGGTSAGTAVMSGTPMISNGLSTTAIIRGAKADVLPQAGCHKTNSCGQLAHNDDLTYRSAGGLGLFTAGIMDTHFSERGRQGRLATLARDTNTQFGFGVDETTAMQVSWANQTPNDLTLEVLGQSGVFIVENNNQKILTHYLTRDDKATITSAKLTLNIAPWKHSPVASPAVKSPAKQTKLAANVPKIFSGLAYKNVAELLCRTDNQQISAKDQWQDQQIIIQIAKTNASNNRQGAIKYSNTIYQYCSYSHYILDF